MNISSKYLLRTQEKVSISYNYLLIIDVFSIANSVLHKNCSYVKLGVEGYEGNALNFLINHEIKSLKDNKYYF